VRENAIKAAIGLFIAGILLFSACGIKTEDASVSKLPETPVPATPTPEPTAAPTPQIPDLQKDLIDERDKTTVSVIGKFDFRNYTYPLPRGWEDPDGDEVQLDNGVRKMTEDKIGLSYVTTKYLDVTGDGHDEAIVILKIVTAGSAIPQLVYIFSWKEDKPELIWYFRTGDRADGGLKDMRLENGLLLIELYGQDRFILGELETSKITGDEEQLCCPTFFSRSYYKWNGKNFLMQGKRLTFSVADPDATPQQNLGEIVNEKTPARKK
jgi:hypothetical protein